MRETSVVVALAVAAAVLLVVEPWLAAARLRELTGLDVPIVVASLGGPLLVLVGTVVGAWSDTLRSVAAGAVLAVGLLAAWASAWRLADEPAAWIGLAGGLLAASAGAGLVRLDRAPSRRGGGFRPNHAGPPTG